MKNLQFMILTTILTIFCFVEDSFADHTEFTYQGELVENGIKANGQYEFEFKLFDAAVGTGELGLPVNLLSVPVEDGIFSVQLSFGDVWNGVDRYLQIAVAKPSDDELTVLTPRQKINNTPMAIYALNAANFDGVGSDGFIKNSTNEQASADFNISGTGKVNFLTAQAIGIGTIWPGARLTVSRPTQSARSQIELRNEGSIQAPNFDGIVFTQGVTGATELGSIILKYKNNGRPDMSFSVRDHQDALYINGNNSDRSGNIGMGTTSPRSPLHVSSDSSPALLVTAKSGNDQDTGIAIVGAHNSTASTDTAYIDLKDFDDDEAGGTEFAMARIGAGLAADTGQTGNLRFYTNNGSGLNEHMRITKDGKVGLGIASPSADLQLFSNGSLQFRMTADADNNNASDQPSIVMVQDGGLTRGSFGFFDSTNDLSIRSSHAMNGSSDILLEAKSRVGIRTNNPQNTLDVRGPGTAVGGQSGLNEVVGRFVQTTSDLHAAASIDAPNFQDPVIYFSRQGQAVSSIRQDYNGSNWQDSVLQVRSHKNGDDLIVLDIALTGSGGVNIAPAIDNASFLGVNFFAWKDVTSYDFSNVSDIRRKQQIRDLDYGISDVMNLRAVRFKWIESPEDGDQLGVIAQEVEKTIPEIVTFSDADPDKIRSVSYTSLIPVLIRGIQDQQLEIESQKEEIAALKLLVCSRFEDAEICDHS